MFSYPLKAKTIKNIDQFRYHIYKSIGVNRLQYNNDSSSILRVLQPLINTSCDILEDLKYKPKFNMSALDFVTIDRFNGFTLDYIPSIEIEKDDYVTSCSGLVGYSRYTGKEYNMEYVNDDNDFTRHSLPCDCFIGDLSFSDGYETHALSPYIKKSTDIKVLNSKVTITPFSGFSSSTIEDRKNITIRIHGLSLTGKEIEEDIVIDTMKEYVSNRHYSLITGLMVLGSLATITVIIHPYIKGEMVEWDDVIVDRESFEEYKTLVSIDRVTKQLAFNTIQENIIFPNMVYQYRLVDLDIQASEAIWAHYIDANNKLIYVITDSAILYCFPLIIPTTYNNILDNIKTEYQSMRVEYINDSINKEFVFYAFPSSRTNDIESLSVFIDGEEYLDEEGKYSNMLLDLFRNNIETNKIVLPYSKLFDGKETALVEFKTFGTKECVLPMWLDNSKLKYLYKKDLSNIELFDQNQPAESIQASITSNKIGYAQFVSGDMTINDQCSLIKLSSIGNILVNGYRIENVFSSFIYSEDTGTVITSDTITNLYGKNLK